MTKIGAGGKFDKDSYKVSGGLHGVGVSCVNALSETLIAKVYRDGKIWQQEYTRGKPKAPVTSIGNTDLRGTEVTFKPDHEIFKQTLEFNFETLSLRMRELHTSIRELKSPFWIREIKMMLENLFQKLSNLKRA